MPYSICIEVSEEEKCGSPSALGLAPSWQTERIAAAAHEDPAHQSNSSPPQMGPIFEITAGKCTTSPTQLAIALPKTGRCPVFVAKNAKIYADHDQSTLKNANNMFRQSQFFLTHRRLPLRFGGGGGTRGGVGGSVGGETLGCQRSGLPLLRWSASSLWRSRRALSCGEPLLRWSASSLWRSRRALSCGDAPSFVGCFKPHYIYNYIEYISYIDIFIHI